MARRVRLESRWLLVIDIVQYCTVHWTCKTLEEEEICTTMPARCQKQSTQLISDSYDKNEDRRHEVIGRIGWEEWARKKNANDVRRSGWEAEERGRDEGVWERQEPHRDSHGPPHGTAAASGALKKARHATQERKLEDTISRDTTPVTFTIQIRNCFFIPVLPFRTWFFYRAMIS